MLPDETGHRLSIIYEREGQEPLNIKGAYIRFVRVGNVGLEPIKQDDIASQDPLRIEIKNARVLDLVVDGISRKTINFTFGPYQKGENTTVGVFTFDFLDQFDGVLFRVLTDNPHAQISVLGTIIGMPQGIRYRNEVTHQMGGSCLGLILSFAWVGLLSIWLTRFYPIGKTKPPETLPWHLSLLFFAVLFGVPLLLMALSEKLFSRVKWPNDLLLPGWYIQQKLARNRVFDGEDESSP